AMPFQRTFSEAATDGTAWGHLASKWKNVIDPIAGVTRPTVTMTSLLVYDWRLHIPALLKAIPQRLVLIAGVEPAFRTDHVYDDEIANRHRQIMLSNYNTMRNGIACGAVSPSLLNCEISCADIYSGFSGGREWLQDPPNGPAQDCASVYA